MTRGELFFAQLKQKKNVELQRIVKMTKVCGGGNKLNVSHVPFLTVCIKMSLSVYA